MITTTPAVQELNKHQLKTKRTRKLLLEAAEAVFVRDGYERAELGRIASLAGRSKGAIYAQFKSKEDLFFALFEERTNTYRMRSIEAIEGIRGLQQSIKSVSKFYLELLDDRAWLRLALEFKLFAIRNQPSKERLKKVYKAMYPQNLPEPWSQMSPQRLNKRSLLSAQVCFALLGPLLSAIAVEQEFAPELLRKDIVTEAARRLIQTLLK
jgi:AcrR family transcriptional regulator